MLLKQVVKDLKRDEGFREYSYPDPLSALYKKYKHLASKFGFAPIRSILPEEVDLDDGKPWTYGFGFTGTGIGPDSKIKLITAERQLEELILAADNKLSSVLQWYGAAPFVVKTVLVNMVFNLGLQGLLGFKNTLKYIAACDYAQAAANMRHSLWFRQVGARAERLVKRIETQEIPAADKAA